MSSTNSAPSPGDRRQQAYEEAQRFLTLLDPQAVKVTFQTFDDSEVRKSENREDKRLARVIHGSLAEHFDLLCRLNDHGAGVFVTINETDFLGRSAANIVRVRALFIDNDGTPPPRDFLDPTIVVATSEDHSHTYYKATGVALDEFRAKQQWLIDTFQGDGAVKDLSRVMRLPGFLHRKREPRLVRIISSNSDAVYTSDQFPKAAEPEPWTPSPDDDPTAAEPILAAALAVIPNKIPEGMTDNWYEWSNMSLRIFAATNGSATGFKLFDKWSQKCKEKYNARNNWNRWDQLERSPPNRTGASKIFAMANEADPSWGPRYDREIEGKLWAAANDDDVHRQMMAAFGEHEHAAVEDEPVEIGGDAAEVIGDVAADRGPRTSAGENKSRTSANDGKQQGTNSKSGSSTADRGPDPMNRSGRAMSAADWIARDLPQPDFISGKWLTTTSRNILYAPTGIGKTMWALGLSTALAGGRPFMHWKTPRVVRVLYVDGEMARTLMKKRVAEEVQRLGIVPDKLFVLSHEDVENFRPLNSREGQAYIDNQIVILGGIDLIVLDNIMSLTAGDMKDTESWARTMPWIKSLTKRNIASLWIHHTGHDESHSYGDKTKEWQINNLIRLERVERSDTDVSFLLKFEKAREREPATWDEFSDVRIALVANTWTWSSTHGVRQKPLSDTQQKYYDALCRACDRVINGYRGTTLENWKASCQSSGLIDPEARPGPARSSFHKFRVELIAKNWVACNETEAWTIGPQPEEEVF